MPYAAKNNDMPIQPRILIANNEVDVQFLAGVIQQENWQVLVASDGPEALRIAEKELPDVILLDAMIPLMDCSQIIKKLKNTASTAAIPIILIASLDDNDERKKGLEADEILNKPVNEVELLTRINSMLRLGRYQDALSIRQKSEVQFCADRQKKAGQTTSELEGTEVSVSDSKESKPSKPIRILLVEDDPKDIKLMRAYLQEPEYRLLTASRGDEALILAEQRPIDLIILDVMLPDMNGFEICKRLKNQDITRRIPVIFTTSLGDVDNRIQGIEVEGDGYLVKPVERRELWMKIQVLVRKKRQWDDMQSIYETTVRSAIGDALTGLYNYAYFKHFLDFEVKRSLRQNNKVALMMIDIDNFKNYNDSFGHLAGDLVLREMGRIIKSCIREIDLAARYGGEEFAVILPFNEDEKVTTNIAERIQSAIASVKLPFGIDNIPQVTVSIGIAFCPFDTNNADDLVDKADMMLYHAKKTGKNKICSSLVINLRNSG